MNHSASEHDSERWFEDADCLLSETRIAETDRSSEGPPSIDGYEAFSELSRGGQGVIYCAVQSATGRRVAIKVLSNLDGLLIANRRRFAREIELIAALDHPGIVRVLDSGVAADGRAFLVMEHLDGCSLALLLSVRDDDRGNPAESDPIAHPRSWPVERALETIAAICDAVHFAHQHGVIHRDLKPGNIQICRDRPCVLDFGIARPLDERTRSTLTATANGSFLGSLPWASPEQVQGRIDELSTATDIYSLGVLAYQVLTASFPYDVDGSLHSIVDNIRSASPVAPSRHRADLHPDVDAIVLRALEKNPKDRYASAADLADDIRRHLAGEPIAVRREQLWRKMQVRLRAARRGLLATMLLTVLLAGLAYGAVVMERKAARAEQAAREQLVQAQRERDRADAVLRVLSQTLASFDPANPTSAAHDTRDVLQVVADRAMVELADEPEALMRALLIVGNAQYNLGDYDRAEAALCRVTDMVLVGRTGTEAEASVALDMAAQALRVLGLISHARHRLEEAEDYLTRSHALRTSARAGRSNVADTTTIGTMIDLAVVHAARGKFGTSRRILEDSVLTIRESASCSTDALLQSAEAIALHRLGELAVREHRLVDAESLLDEAASMLQRLYGAGGVHLADCLVTQSDLYNVQRRHRRARSTAGRAVAIYADRVGASHVRTAFASIALAESLFALDASDSTAESLLTESVAVLQAQLGDDHPTYAFALERLGTLHYARGDYARALEFYEPARVVLHGSADADPAARATVESRLACCAGLQGSDTDTVSTLREGLEELRRVLPPTDHRIAELQLCLDELMREP